MEITANMTHSGQYRAYGDSFTEWEILTEKSEADVLNWCLSNLCKKSLPSYDDWKKNAYSGDYAYYFSGYYTICPIQGGYHFTICHPYAD